MFCGCCGCKTKGKRQKGAGRETHAAPHFWGVMSSSSKPSSSSARSSLADFSSARRFPPSSFLLCVCLLGPLSPRRQPRPRRPHSVHLTPRFTKSAAARRAAGPSDDRGGLADQISRHPPPSSSLNDDLSRPISSHPTQTQNTPIQASSAAGGWPGRMLLYKFEELYQQLRESALSG